MRLTLQKKTGFKSSPKLPCDKSFSHRVLMLGSVAQGVSRIQPFLFGEDVFSTLSCMEALGVEIHISPKELSIRGRGFFNLKKPDQPLNCGNSGTTMRLLTGLLCGAGFESTLHGDASLSRRPMKRVTDPLIGRGANITLENSPYSPIRIQPVSRLNTLEYCLAIPSAQIKSALLLSGLFAKGETILTGEIHSRTHTEKLLSSMGAPLSTSRSQICLQPLESDFLRPFDLSIPKDPSAAAFWAALCCLLPQTEIEFSDVLLSPERSYFFEVLRKMGAKIESEILSENPETIGSIRVQSQPLKAVEIHAKEVPWLIDELPLVGILGCFADGITSVRGAKELRIKETDRIETLAKNLRMLGANIETFEDGFQIQGPQKLRGAVLDSYGDHRIAMAFAVTGSAISGTTEIKNADCIQISDPHFQENLQNCLS